MTVKIMREITQWRVPYRQPNHVYLMSGDRVLAMSRWGEQPPEYLPSQNRINLRGRKFLEIKHNQWGFDLDITVAEEPGQHPKGQTWPVTGSKGDTYLVSLERDRWSCTCPGHGFRGRCRHVDALRASVQLPG